MRTKQVIVLCLISFIWGSGWIFASLLVEVAAPFAASALVLMLAAVALALASVLLRIRNLNSTSPSIPEVPVTLWSTLRLAVCMFVLPSLLLLVAQQHGAAGWIPFLYAFLPIALAFTQNSPHVTWHPFMVVAIGAILMLLNGSVPFQPGRLPAAALALFAVLSQGYALRLGQRSLRNRSLRILLSSLAAQCALASVAVGIASFFFDKPPLLAPWSQWSGGPALPVIAACILGVIGTAIPYAGLYWLLARSPLQPFQLATTQWLQTLVFSAESAFFARILPPWLAWVAAGTVLVASVFILRQPMIPAGMPVVFQGTSRD
jgi:drug/metabolite transporter (DMT)-like permease